MSSARSKLQYDQINVKRKEQSDMMKTYFAAPVAALVVAATMSVGAADVSVKSLPPSVIKTLPECGDTAVDPALKEIRVTFSKDMVTNRMWSICQTSKETFPESGGQIHYTDKRTCVMPVKLEPGKTYVLWFNRGQFNSFRDAQNNSSIPYQLVFQTRR
jgi:hypothetical protein